MALVLADRVKETSVTVGTGTFTLDGAVNGYQSFSVAIGGGNTCYYTIAGQVSSDWEVGIGTVGTGTLARTTVLSSSNSGSLVNFIAGTKDVFVTYPAERSVYLDSAGSYPVQNTFNTLNAANAVLTAGTISTTPAASTDIVNKTYVDTLVASGVHFHTPVRLESPTPLTATYNNGTAGVGATLTNAGTQVALSIDGVATAVNDRILVYTQTNATQNGVYVVTSIGSGSTNWVMTRSDDTDTYGIDSPNALSQGSTFFVSAGVTGAGETYTCNTVGTITFGTTNITFAQISSAQIYSAGTGLTLSSTTFSITNTAVTAGSYGSASSVPNYSVNAQGQLTNAANTPIAITSAAVSGLAASATTDTTNASNISSGTLPTARLSGSYTGITGVGTIAAGTWQGSAIGPTYGGTGFTGYTTGDVLYANTATTLAKLAAGTNGYVLTMAGGIPSWAASSDVTTFSAGTTGLTPSTATSGAVTLAGTLVVSNGGTGVATLTGVAYGNGTSAFTAATGAQIATAIGSTTITNATNATNATNTGITNDAATAVAVYPTWVTANTGNLPQKTTSAALSFVPSTGTLSATVFSGSGASLTALNASNLSTGTVPGDRGVTAGSTTASFVEYNGTTATAGQFDGGTTTPTSTTRLNYGGYFYPTFINLIGSGDTATAASHYFVENGSDGFVRPKTLANVQTEIVTTATVNAAAATTVGTITSGVWNGTAIGVVYGGTGLTSVTSTRIPYGNGTGALNTSANLNYNGTSFIVGAATAPTFTGASSQPYSYVVANSLATTLNATSDLLSLGNSNGNQNYLRMFQYRNTAAGTDWTTATTKIQAITDVTAQGYIEFNPKSGNYGIAFGNGSTEYVRILNGGAISFGTTGTATGTSGQVLTSAGSGASPTWTNASSNITTQGLYENNATISANYTIGTGNNAISAGPITVNSGVVVTVPSGSTWVVV